MRKNIILTLVLILTTLNLQASSFEEDSQDFIDLINKEMMTLDTAYPLNGVAVSDDCQKFMDKNLVYGDLGQFISRELLSQPKQYSELLNASAMNSACAKYNELTVNQRILIWTLTLAAMAHFESSCNQNASAKGPNGTAYGLFQLHKNKEAGYDNNLKVCQNGDSQNPKRSSQCVLSMLNQQIKNTGLIFTNKSYWDVLRPNGSSKKAKVIYKAISNSAICKKWLL